LEERVGERRPVTIPDAAVRGDIPAGCRANISGVLAENDDLLSLPLSSKLVFYSKIAPWLENLQQ